MAIFCSFRRQLIGSSGGGLVRLFRLRRFDELTKDFVGLGADHQVVASDVGGYAGDAERAGVVELVLDCRAIAALGQGLA